MRSKNKIVLFIIVFIVLLGVVFYWNWQRNVYSKEILKLEILGPSETTLLENIEYQVKYKNNGTVRLEEARLIFEYPQNAIVPEGKSLWQEISLEDIYPGQERTISFPAQLIGKLGENLVAKAALSYRPKNLNARYESVTTFTTVISQSPFTFNLELPSKMESGKNFTIKINYFSNLNFLLSDLRIQVDYPLGFEFISSTSKPLEKNEWVIPVLNPFQGGRIEITGQVLGDVKEAKIFRAKLGVFQNGEFILIAESQKGLEIIKPSIYIRQEINGNPQYVASPGQWLHYEIYFKNIGEEALTNLFMVCRLEGDAFDFQTVRTDLGQAEAGSNSVVFDWQRISKLQYLLPMEEGRVDFWIKLKDDLGEVRNPALKNKIFVSQVEEEFLTKISTKIEISQKGYFQDEIFGSSGAMPPRVGEITTYTISWQVKSYHSLAKDVKAKAVLPLESNLTGKIFPEEEASKFSFDTKSREIVWSVGELKPGEIKTLVFQISFRPTEEQKEKTPEIIGEAKIFGEDDWTGKIVEASSRAIDTTLPDDPAINEEIGKVQ